MIGFLLDTCALSEALKVTPNAGYARWLASVDPRATFLSVLTLGEIRKGVDLLATSRKKAAIEAWLASTLPAQFAGRILMLDEGIANRWGRLCAGAKRSGIPLSPIDSLIGATALHHNLSVVTNNDKHFVPAAVATTNPWT